jgi:hypothetical protein
MFYTPQSSELSVTEIAFFEAAVQKYTQLVENCHVVDLIMLNNRGVCRLTIGIAARRQSLIDSAIEDFITVTMRAVQDSPEYVFAKRSLVLAHKAHLFLVMLNAHGNV